MVFNGISVRITKKILLSSAEKRKAQLLEKYSRILNGKANESSYCQAKPSLKIRTAGAIFWNYLGIFRDYGLIYIFLGIKLFCFSR